MHPTQNMPGVRSSGVDHAKNTMQATAVMHIVAGSVSAAVGAAAIGVRAGFSYLAVPIWSGLFFFLFTGILGLFTYRRGGVNTCMVGAYLGMGIMSLLAALNIIVLICIAAGWEYAGCWPLTFYLEYPCNTVSWVRQFLDALIVVVAGFEAAVSIASISAAACRTPCCISCCKSCCNSDDTSDDVQPAPAASFTSGNMHNAPVYFAVQEGQSFHHPGGLQTQERRANSPQIILMQSQGTVQTGVPQTGQRIPTPVPVVPVVYQPQHAAPPPVHSSLPVVTAQTSSTQNTSQKGIRDMKYGECEVKSNSAAPPTKTSEDYLNEIGAVGGNYSYEAEDDGMTERWPIKDKTALLDTK